MHRAGARLVRAVRTVRAVVSSNVERFRRQEDTVKANVATAAAKYKPGNAML